MSLVGKIIHYFAERTARSLDFPTLHTRLKASGDAISGRAEQAADTPANREALRHITGIERWAQHRLHSVLDGSVVVMDEYDAYSPAADLDLKALRSTFQQARTATLALVDELQKVPGAESKTVPHNDLGALSLRGWLVYLDMHSGRESRSIK